MDENKVLDYKGLNYFYNKLKTDPAFAGGVSTIPAGLIAIWSGSVIPVGWVLCDGKNNTPDLSDKFIVGTTDLTDNNTSITLNEAGSLFIAGEEFSYYKLAYIMKVNNEDEEKLTIYKAGDGISIDEDVISVINPINGIITQSNYDRFQADEKNKGVWFVVADEATSASNSSKLESATSRPSLDAGYNFDSSVDYAPESDTSTSFDFSFNYAPGSAASASFDNAFNYAPGSTASASFDIDDGDSRDVMGSETE